MLYVIGDDSTKPFALVLSIGVIAGMIANVFFSGAIAEKQRQANLQKVNDKVMASINRNHSVIPIPELVDYIRNKGVLRF